MLATPSPVADRREDQPRGSAPLRVAVIDTDSGFLQVLTKRMTDLEWEHRTLASAVPPESLVPLRLNAVVLNLAVLGSQGWAYLGQLSEAMPGLALVICTGGSTVAQRVRGLRLGADDWITKPCHPEEVIARVEAVARRRKRAEPDAALAATQTGGVTIRPDQFQAFAGVESLDLTRREFELLGLLAAAPGRVLPREEIYQRVWGYSMAHGDRSVDVFVRKLRQKLERGSPDWRYIHTHFGVGYRFAAEPAGADPDPSAETGPQTADRVGPEADAESVRRSLASSTP